MYEVAQFYPNITITSTKHLQINTSKATGSHNTDLSQVTTLQYCIIDNCAIMRIDTGQQLDIVYTTESLLVVTSIDDHTSMVIAKIDNENALS